MRHRLVPRLSLSLSAFLALVAVLFAARKPAAPAAGAPAPGGEAVSAAQAGAEWTTLDGAALYARHCGRCHTVEELAADLRAAADPAAAAVEWLEFLEGHGRASALEDVAILRHVLAP